MMSKDNTLWKVWNELAAEKTKTYTLQPNDMKLLLCLECSDIFNLTKTEKFCGCGKTYGKYVDELNAEIFGNCQPIGFANGSFIQSIKIQRLRDKQPKKKECCKGVEFTAFFIPSSATSITHEQQ